MYEIFEKLKAEWKTFALSVVTTVVGAYELVKDTFDVDLPSLFAWVDDKYRTAVLFGVGLLMLILRRYRPTDVEK